MDPVTPTGRVRFFKQLVTAIGVCSLLLAVPGRIFGQASAEGPRVSFAGPPAPVPPAVVSERDEQGRVTVRAVRLTESLVVDGRLDEDVYRKTSSFGNFIQQEPDEGQPATETTEVWIFFDDRHVYVSARLHVSQPHRLTANELRRDSVNIFRNDYFGVTLDTLFDHRSGIFVMTNAIGGQRDALVTDEARSLNFDYNAIWDVKSQRFDQGWMTEMAIPFKSLRYPQRREQVWNVVLSRTDWWKNESSYLTPIPRTDGMQGSFRVSAGATLVGIEAPPPALNLELKPYVTADSSTTPASTGSRTAVGRDFGFDVKYGLKKTLTADFTYNTDFAQAEVDDQQINLTRFGLFYPEKREFFLEGQGLFSFGGASSNGTGEAPIIFFSRRIGLDGGQAVPIQAGGRLLGKAGAYNIGILSILTDALPSARVTETRSSVIRIKRDILRRSSVGVVATERAPSGAANGANYVVGADVSLALFRNVEAVSYYARSRTPGRSGDEESYRGRFFFNGDKYGLDLDHLKIGSAFNPEMGFLVRDNIRRTYLMARYSPRPTLRGVRRLTWDGRIDNIAAAANGELQTRTGTGTFRAEFKSGDILTATLERTDDRPERAFDLPGGLVVQPGTHVYGQGTLTYQLGNQRKVTGTVSAVTGSFYGGEQTTVSYNGRVELTTQLAVEPRLSISSLSFEERGVTTRLLALRTTYSMTARMFVAAFLQYNSAAGVVGLNTRFRWEYGPGSDLFLVYSEGRDTTVSGFRGQSSRQLVAKFTRLFRF
ncbi:MAG: hypothetical protein GEU82_08415 [Luteitalea sp.]|nr:hypothetical protein [Luteitalea sp.]